jgi:hypothetical protein
MKDNTAFNGWMEMYTLSVAKLPFTYNSAKDLWFLEKSTLDELNIDMFKIESFIRESVRHGFIPKVWVESNSAKTDGTMYVTNRAS